MNAPLQHPLPLSRRELILAVTGTAALAEAEIEAAFRFREGSAIRDWHLERADTATVELLGLINGPQHREIWERLAAPDETVTRRLAIAAVPRVEVAE